jgi:outer membrane protein assembly factor BamB
MTDKETMQWLGYSIDNGNQLWGPVGNVPASQYFGSPMFPGQSGYTYMGNLYCTGYGGILYCYDTTTGNLKWTYGNGGVGNSTDSGLDTPWGDYPMFPAGFADGKVYVYTTEHSPNAPPYKGSRVRCIDATTGTEVWTLMSWSSSAFAIADGYAVWLNLYDNQVTVVGKGPSKTTVTVSPGMGNVMTIQGTVTDVCAGANKLVDSGEFAVVPAISDADMGRWMEYIHMQKPMPTDAVGVAVKLQAIDPNGNWQEIGTVNSDTSGTFAAMWTPPVPGLYKIIATFEGSNGYFGSSAVSYISVSEAPAASPTVAPTTAPTVAPTTAPTAAPTASPSVVPEPEAQASTDIYIIAAAAAVIVVVAAVAAVFLKKRK